MFSPSPGAPIILHSLVPNLKFSKVLWKAPGRIKATKLHRKVDHQERTKQSTSGLKPGVEMN